MKKLIIIVILFQTINLFGQEKGDVNRFLLNQIVATTIQNHVQAKELNDSLSVELFSTFFYELDPEHLLFTQAEIELLSAYKYQVDDELVNGQIDFFEAAISNYRKQLLTVQSIIDSILLIPLSFNYEVIEEKNSILPFPLNQQELNNKWGNRILLDLYNAAYESQNTEPITIQKNIKDRYAIWLKNQLDKSDQELFFLYVNTYLKVNDSQSSFLSVEEKKKWDADFNRTYVGIGVRFEMQNNQPKILEVIENASAWEEGTLKSGDLITNLKNKEGKWIDTYGMETNDVILLLLGEKNSQVEIKAKSMEGAMKSVTLERKEIPLERLTSLVYTDTTYKINYAYLKLPRFYAGGHSSSEDVLDALKEINLKGIKHLVLDIRNNQGGSAREAIAITGYFLDGGRIMQSNYGMDNSRTFDDPDSLAQYFGNLVILTNTKSSSASELLAGTLQDYNRAIIVGSVATYGKGTSQRFFTIDSLDKNLGELKLTIGKFFTASGKSTQYKGVKPNVILPDQNIYENSGGRNGRYHLHIADLEKIKVVQKVNQLQNKEEIVNRCLKRVSENSYFQGQENLKSQIKSTSTEAVKYRNFLAYQKQKIEIGSTIQHLKNKSLEEIADSSHFQLQSIINSGSSHQHDFYIEECLLILSEMDNLN